MDRDGKVSFREFFYGLYDLVSNYDEKSHNDSHHSDHSMDASAKVLFSQLDKDFDGYLPFFVSIYSSFLYSTLSIFSYGF